MTKRALIRVGSTISAFILFALIGGIFLNSLLTSAATASPAGASLSTASTSASYQPTSDPVAAAPTSSATAAAPAPTATADAAIPQPTASARPTAPTPSSAPAPNADGKLIVVSLATQSLSAYENGKVVATTVVATGRPALPTLPGTFHIMAKYAPYKFVSPWPKSSPYWYASAWTNYAMLYQDDGYFIHDAPWRTNYGPGSNLTNGTHGCVNVPLSTMAFLYKWAPVGTTVVVR
ncbi:MAG: L,D-transpeptidase [Candidatus Dormibacteraeota bacterium]|nr:L,D-transpeptidase [Candidatus Dormibacteraeota bacterium]